MAGRPSLLTPELVAQAEELANDGLPLAMIAEALGVHRTTCSRWVREAESCQGDELKTQFRSVILRAERNWARSLVGSLKRSSDDGNAFAATWILTHHPALRDHFSDAAAERKTERRTVAETLAAIIAADIPPEYERRIIAQYKARGLTGEVETQV